MQPPFDFNGVLAFGSMAICLLVGAFLRGNIKFFQRFLIPSCLIGGLIGMIGANTGVIFGSQSIFEMFAYHFFIISYISVGLTHSGDKDKTPGRNKSILKGAWWMALMNSVSMSSQAIIGCLCVIVFGLLGVDLFATFGLFLPLGFTQGPGQALAFGKVWEGLGIQDAATIGLAFAASGFVFAFFVGVPLVNWGVKRKLTALGKVELPESFFRGYYKDENEQEQAGKLTMHTANIDTLAFQMALVGLVYVISYFLISTVNRYLPEELAQMHWGFFFFFALFVAVFIRTLMRKLNILHLVDPGIQRRITGWSVDFLIISTIVSVKVAIVWKYIVPITVIVLLGGTTTTALLWYFGRRLDSLNFERMVAQYGACTGTASSGLLLLRIIDPEFKTSVAFEEGVFIIFAFPFITTCMIMVNAPLLWSWSLWTTIGAYSGILLLNLFLVKISGFWGKPKF